MRTIIWTFVYFVVGVCVEAVGTVHYQSAPQWRVSSYPSISRRAPCRAAASLQSSESSIPTPLLIPTPISLSSLGELYPSMRSFIWTSVYFLFGLCVEAVGTVHYQSAPQWRIELCPSMCSFIWTFVHLLVVLCVEAVGTAHHQSAPHWRVSSFPSISLRAPCCTAASPQSSDSSVSPPRH